MRLPRIHKARAGFTLIELLVVIGLILVLVGITVSISYSGLIDGYKTVGAGDRASGWLLISKSKATREGAPRGVRFIIGQGNLIKEAQYIEVPDPYVARPENPNDVPRIVFTDNGMGLRTATLVGVNITDLNLNIATGDTLSLPEFGLLLRLDSLALPLIPPTGPTKGLLPVNQAFLPALSSATSTTTTAFGFIRKARPMLGEPLLQLTGDNAIDAGPNMSVANVNTVDGAGNYFIDVLFAPNGEVLNTTLGKTILWVRNTSTSSAFTSTLDRTAYEAAGQMSLVVVYTKTGAISTQPVQLPQGGPGAIFPFPPFTAPNSPYQFANDGINSGL